MTNLKTINNYSLISTQTANAISSGLANANWYTCEVAREDMRKLLVRRDGPAIRDTLIWFSLLAISAYSLVMLWGSLWVIVPISVYGILYGSVSDSRWHESSHGTAFKTDWLNNILYEIASFMIFRESTVWRWSHTRHHSDTIIVGRDPEIAVPRPPSIRNLLLQVFGLRSVPKEMSKMLLHCIGRLEAEEASYIPATEHKTIFFKARIYIAIYALVIIASVYSMSILPLILIGLPSLYGRPLAQFFGITQHAGLAENVLDHRLNTRTIYMNPLLRFLYWNMNYHLEHHMFPMVPYHALPKLHELIKADCPKPYNSTLAAYREIIPALLQQRKDPGFYVRKTVPDSVIATDQQKESVCFHNTVANYNGLWISACPAHALLPEDIVRFDFDHHTYSIYRTTDDQFFCTDGICSHGNTHLVNGRLNGNIIECPKHNARFDIRNGGVKRGPACVRLNTYPVQNRQGMLYIQPKPQHPTSDHGTLDYEVVSNLNVATFIKELILRPKTDSQKFKFTPGDYLQLEIPSFNLAFSQLAISDTFIDTWKRMELFNLIANNETPSFRNYSIANNPNMSEHLKFNIRIALPPNGLDCAAGTGSSYAFNLKPGDTVTARGPMGNFHPRHSPREMIYIGGGAGMAPLRSHISHWLETENTQRKLSFWYGARSPQELFYQDYFLALEKKHANFSFEVAFSEQSEVHNIRAHSGFIHDVVSKKYLAAHPCPSALDYYLCGPPLMIDATTSMLKNQAVPDDQIFFDVF